MLYSMESQKILCDVCGTSIVQKQSLLRHVREVHQGMKRKREVTERKSEIAKIDKTTTTPAEDNIVVIPNNTAIVVIPSNTAIVVIPSNSAIVVKPK